MALLGDSFKVSSCVWTLLCCNLCLQGLVGKEAMFEHVLEWKRHLSEAQLPDCKEKDAWSPELGQWLAAVRLGSGASPSPHLSEEDTLRLRELLKDLKLSGIHPEDVLVVCEVGSKLYNLALPTSDSDYIVIFRHPTSAILSSVRSLRVSVAVK